MAISEQQRYMSGNHNKKDLMPLWNGGFDYTQDVLSCVQVMMQPEEWDLSFVSVL